MVYHEPPENAHQVFPETLRSLGGEYAPSHAEHPPEAVLTTPEKYVIPDVDDHRVPVEQKTALAKDVLAQVFPDVDASLLSDEGVYCIVLQDGEMAYKIWREQPSFYSRIENEAVALSVLGQEGIAPRFVALVDAAPEYRRERDHGITSSHIAEPLFEGQRPILRVPSPNPVPILVSELITDAQLVEELELPVDFVIAQFDKIVRALVKHNLRRPEDCHAYYDPSNNRIVLIDFGHVDDIERFNPKERADYPDLTDGEYATAFIVSRFIAEFMPKDKKKRLHLDDAVKIIKEQGMAGIHALFLR